jgi:poly(hydroxyalkanoate) depolymerase family esterase
MHLRFVRHITRALHARLRPVAAGGAIATVACALSLAVIPAASATVPAASTARSSATSAAAPAAGAALPAPQETLQEITSFGPNPTSLRMFLYVPQHVRPHPAIIVAMHYCGGSGPAFFSGTEFASLADKYGFIVIYPSVTRTSPIACFDVSTPGALRHDGDSDPVGIVSMVRWAQRDLHASRSQVFATGISSGAMMTDVLLGDYPNVFAAGSIMSGVPFGCFAAPASVLWNTACATGTVIKTPQQWGDMVRGADPGYRGPRPRVQIWHGTADAILFYPNFGQEVGQWTNVLHARLAYVNQPQPTWTHSVYVNRKGQVEVDAYSVQGETHNLGFDYPDWAQIAIQFFGLTSHRHIG